MAANRDHDGNRRGQEAVARIYKISIWAMAVMSAIFSGLALSGILLGNALLTGIGRFAVITSELLIALVVIGAAARAIGGRNESSFRRRS